MSLKRQWAHAARFEGRVRPVLLEAEMDASGRKSGYTPEYVRVAVEHSRDLPPGSIVPVTLEGIKEGMVRGRSAAALT